MRVFIYCIALNGYDKLWEKCIKTQQEYCARYDYDYGLITTVESKLDLHPKWRKIECMVNFLQNGKYNLIVLFDADLQVQPDCPPITSLITPDKHIYCALGCSERPNSGMIIAKRTPEVLTFFQGLLERRNEPVPSQYFVTAEGDNGRFITEYNDNKELFEIIDWRWNNNRDPRVRDYIRHYCGRIPKT